jgi:cell wall integrity and stress response component
MCVEQCNGKFAYAVVGAGDKCWCTNITPQTTVPNTECDLHCPGYPTETCGGTNLLTYLLVNQALVEEAKDASSAVTTNVHVRHNVNWLAAWLVP